MPDADKAPALQKDLSATEAAKRVKRAAPLGGIRAVP